MSGLGWTLVVFSAISMMLSFVDANLVVFWWVDLYGPIAGWLIRIAILVGGIWLIRTADD